MSPERQLAEILSRLLELQQEGLAVREEEQEILGELHPLLSRSTASKSRQVAELRQRIERLSAERDVLRLVAGLAGAEGEDGDEPGKRGYVAAAVRAVERMPLVEKGCIVLFDRDGDASVVETIRVAATERGLLDEQISTGIVASVRTSGETIYSDEAVQDAHWKDMQSVHAMGMKTVLCCPIRDHAGGPTRGALYLENRTIPDAFAPPWRAAVGLLAAQMSHRLGLLERVEAVGGDPTQPYRSGGRYDDIVGTSACTARWLADIDRVTAESRLRPVLVMGESGVGKGLTAQALHRNGPRRDGPFVRVNLAAMNDTLAESELFGTVKGAFTGSVDRDGLFAHASGGVIFLDEIGEASLQLQQKLLGVLDDYCLRPVGSKREVKVDVWIVAATNRDLAAAVEQGTFRGDLYKRLARRLIVVPPLRERPGDIEALVQHFVQRESEHRGTQYFVSPELLVTLQSMPLEGNVRDIETLVEAIVDQAGGTVLTAEHLRQVLAREAPRPPGTLDHSWDSANAAFQERYIRWAWKQWGPTASSVAQALQMHRGTLYRVLNRLGLEIKDLEGGE